MHSGTFGDSRGARSGFSDLHRHNSILSPASLSSCLHATLSLSRHHLKFPTHMCDNQPTAETKPLFMREFTKIVEESRRDGGKLTLIR